jgi:hypothetical protein
MTFPPIEAAILRRERHRFALESLAIALAETRAAAASIERKIERARQAMAQATAELSRAREDHRYV